MNLKSHWLTWLLSGKAGLSVESSSGILIGDNRKYIQYLYKTPDTQDFCQKKLRTIESCLRISKNEPKSMVCTSEVLLVQSPCVTCWAHLWVPWRLTPTTLPVRGTAVPFLNPVSGTLPPHSTLLLHHTTPPPRHPSPAFSPSLSLSATWGNDSITYDPIHLLMMSEHSKAHLRPIKGSSHSLHSLLGTSTRKLILQGYVCVCVWGGGDQLHVYVNIPCRFFPYSFSSETLTSFWFVYECMLGESGGGERCARNNIWHWWDADTCRWTSESAFRIIRN